jgi:hypothetical protein
VAETFKQFINQLTYGPDFELIDLLHTNIAYHTDEDLNTAIDNPDNRWNIQSVPYDTLTSRATPSSNGQLSFYARNFESSDQSLWYMTKNNLNLQIVMKVKNGFKLQVTATPGFHVLYNWYY